MTTTIRRIAVALALVASLLTVGTGVGATSARAAVTANSPYFQIIGASRVDSLTKLTTGALSPAVANYFFNKPKAYMTSGANGKTATDTVSRIASAHKKYPLASQTWLFNSYGANYLTKAPGILGVFGTGGVYGPGKPNPPYLSVVQYDPEGQSSNGTPLAESAALNAGDLRYVKAVAGFVHAKGLKFLFSPSTDVGMVGSAGSFPTKYTTWLRQHRGAWSAAGEDVYSIQSQQAEGTAYFTPFVTQALAQCKLAAPTIPVGIGIGFNPHSPPTVITTPILLAAYKTGLQVGSSGFWHNVELGVNANVPASVYVNFFNQVYAGA